MWLPLAAFVSLWPGAAILKKLYSTVQKCSPQWSFGHSLNSVLQMSLYCKEKQINRGCILQVCLSHLLPWSHNRFHKRCSMTWSDTSESCKSLFTRPSSAPVIMPLFDIIGPSEKMSENYCGNSQPSPQGCQLHYPQNTLILWRLPWTDSNSDFVKIDRNEGMSHTQSLFYHPVFSTW